MIDDATTPEHETASWVTGVLAALQAAVLSLAVVVLPAVAVFVATSADPGNESTSWPAAVVTGAGLWLLAHGVPLVTAGSVVSVIPIGLTALAVLACYASARRTAQRTWSALGAAVGTYVLVTVLVVLLAGFAGAAQLGSAVLGGLGVAGLGAGAALLSTADRPDLPQWWGALERVPASARLGARAGLAAVAMVVAVASLLVLAWVFMGRSRSMDVVTALDVTGFDAAALALGQSTLVPNVVLWAVSWVAGPGFAVGSGSHFAPTDVVMGPMPVFPILGAMPAESLPGAFWLLGPAAVAAAGALAALLVRRAAERWRDVGLAGLTIGLTAGASTAVLMDLAGGSAGPGRMAEIGADPLVVGLVVGGEVAVGALLLLVLAHPTTRRGVTTGWRRLRRGDAKEDATDAPGEPTARTALTPRTARTARTSRTAPSPVSAPSVPSPPSAPAIPAPPVPSPPGPDASPPAVLGGGARGGAADAAEPDADERDGTDGPAASR
ncbi:hypothetical protein SAMN04488035_0509 [Flavimobilis marinus]|uniref:Uncharacterized protein n=1 Tax=Flavimobilis marinus TaxID=285351 RepID=A0A1I2DD94_9MICO|nr:hypothetical protein SAMN04488035_0509 [Flavimobilis marinus]